jgi:aminoglycoside phosphotransferase (APT) family kinase protein
VYAVDAGRLLKLFHRGCEDRATNEAIALEAAAHALLPVPRLLGRIELDGRVGLVLERQSGPLLIDRLRRNPWHVGAAGHQLAELHARVHAVPAPAGLWDLHDRVAERLERVAASLPPGIASRAFAELSRLPAGASLCHADLHPGHVLLTGTGPVLIDWSDAARGDPSADIALSLFLMRFGAQPVRNRLLNAAAALARRRLVWNYARRSLLAGEADEEKLKRWGPVIAIAWIGIAGPIDPLRIVRIAALLPSR